ncbi:hypothetical protein HGB07_02745 [Candidatus Roizmanbacteria bacterium]|nr:hypothetical protein [Candidatus Roizmanbacteria bacterium]
MKNQSNHSNFWSGYAMGAASAALIAYFMGSKNGRAKLQSMITFVEEHELDPDKIIEMITNFTQASEENPESEPHEPQQPEPTNIHSLMGKMKNLLEEKKEIKKFLVKSGKILTK